MWGRGIHVVGSDYGFAIDVWPNRFRYARELVIVVALRIFALVPETDGQDFVVIGIGNEKHLVLKALLFSEDGQHFIVRSAADVVGLSGLTPKFYYSCKHPKSPSAVNSGKLASDPD
jgi:hypothetical protein